MADIFDKIVGGINKGVATIGVGSNAMVEKAKIKTIMSNLENERKQLAEILGMKTYTIFAESDEPPEDGEIAGIVAEIRTRLEETARLEAELRRIEAEAAKVSGHNPGFAASQSGQGKICACGCVNETGSKFCGSCGRPM